MKNLYILKECISCSQNGIGTYIKQLIHCLSEEDISVNILAFNSDREVFEIEQKENIGYYHFPPFPNKDLNSNYLIIDKFLRLYIPDSSLNIFLFNNSPTSSLMKIIRRSHPLSRQIYAVHDMAWTSYLSGDLSLYLRLLKQREEKEVSRQYANMWQSFNEEVKMCTYADRVLVLSEDTYNLLAGHYPLQKDKLVLIPNALAKKYERWPKAKRKKMKADMLLEADEKIVLYVGRMTELKGVFVYLEAFKEIVKKYPSCRLVMVGAVPDWEYVQEKCWPVSTRIHFTGLISPDELEKWYQIADMGIFPSYTEQCSYVGLEMMAHGLPVVASDGFGVRCMFNEQNAEIAKIGDRSSTKEYKKELIRCTVETLAGLDEKKKKALSFTSANDDRYAINAHKALYKACFYLED